MQLAHVVTSARVENAQEGFYCFETEEDHPSLYHPLNNAGKFRLILQVLVRASRGPL